jgi:hypothetical protein
MYYYSIALILILIFILILIYNKKNIQQFIDVDFAGYNSSVVPENKIETDFDIVSDNLENILNSNNLDKDYNEDLSEYDLFNTNIEFPYLNIFKNFILNYFNKTVTIYKDDNCYISEIFNIYFKERVDGYTKYIFYINLVNPVKLFTKSLKIKLSINKITEKIILNYITYNNNKIININGIDPNSGNFYMIKNRLRLMDPFLTTGKEMIVSKNMIDKFKTVLQMKIQSQKMLKKA